jgi:hypothetical protein
MGDKHLTCAYFSILAKTKEDWKMPVINRKSVTIRDSRVFALEPVRQLRIAGATNASTLH